jgi:glutaredoxin
MKIILLITSLLFFTNTVHAEIYKWVDENGKVNFSDKKPKKRKVEKIKLKINSYASVTYDTSLYGTGNNVIIYTTEKCVFCKKAKRYFKKNNIAYTEYDIEKNASAKKRYDAMGATGVPVILIGKKRMNGFSVAGFERIFKN